MHMARVSNHQNANKQKDSSMKHVISMQSDGSVKCATTSESLTQNIRGSLCSSHDQLLQCHRADGSEWWSGLFWD